MQYNRIKEILSAKGIKQVWLAEQLGKSFRTVNTYVTNTVQPPIPVLYRIAEILQVHPTELLVDEPKDENVSLKKNSK
ncbi:MAG: helix-turn-helix transcriptional regulator [Prevotellaceae bacterium]|nr:helix-turn-helix transcriptional regulator [Prevotellaceae bacterium]